MKLYYISWIPAAALMVIIFCFSAKPADISGQSSMFIAKAVLTTYEQVSNQRIAEADVPGRLEAIDHIVRKTAHFCEYALLACTIILHLLALHKKGSWLNLAPVMMSAVYAATDEFHQTFIFGRSGRISDVLLDTSGAAAGALFFCVLLILIRKRTNKNQNTFSLN
jgi:VanZ family protein